MKFWQRLIWASVIVSLLVSSLPVWHGQAGQDQQTSVARQKARTLLTRLTPEEKVGQLFLITFQGTDTSKKSQIYELVNNRHVGGVILSRSYDNFVGGDKTVAEAQRLSRSIQTLEYDSSQTYASLVSGGSYYPAYIPLLIGISQEGNQYPYDQILSGLTPLPNQMAIGATWSTDLAKKVGTVMGTELKAIGVNLLLGPSMDVLDVVRTEGSEDLGTRTFGGDPYWVSEMGRAYISGLHQGSNQQMAVIASHFPGRGGSDRPPEDEVATVRKSLEQLKQIEMAPFFAVTGNAPSSDAAADGLLVSHIRYQGLQGNIRATTKPVSFDQTALDLILNLPIFATWRTGGGLVVSDNLGSQAVRRFFDPTGKSFDARQVARNAFLAGNDLLYLNNFIGSGETDSYTTILHTLEFFAQKYREDQAFAQRVDASVERILTLKYRLYPDFELAKVLPAESALLGVGQSQISFDVARQSATLISPEQAELLGALPRAPDAREKIVFISDTLSGRQCTTCPEQPALAVDALQSAVLRLYGPRAGGQVLVSQLTSYSMQDLYKFVNGDKNAAPIEEELKYADWVVFGMLKVSQSAKESEALRRLLREKSDLLRNKKVVVFAFDAPYYLDATDISKLTAYFGMYAKGPSFVDVAARLLFQELTPSGTLPVSVSGVGYDLIQRLTPNSKQVIPLFLDLPEQVVTPGKASTPAPTPVPQYKVGDTIPLRTGVILDNNRHPVPDGTVVRFLFSTSETAVGQQMETTTTQGVAHGKYRIERPGRLEIRVSSDPATVSDLLRIEIVGIDTPAAITIIAPTSPPLPTTEPSLTPSPTVAALVTPVSAGTGRVDMADWLVAFILVLACTVGVYALGVWVSSARWGVRWALVTLIGGLAAYNYLAFQLPGSTFWVGLGAAGTLLFTFLGSVLGLSAGWIWFRSASTDRMITGPK